MPALPALDWNDLQILLALARCGTLRRAAERTRLSPATLSRRLDQLEAALGETLIERLPTGCQLTAAGQRVFAHAEDMERLAGEVGRTRDLNQADRAQGTVRVNADEWVSFLLTRALPALRDRHPQLAVEVLTSHRPYSLSRGEADIAVRAFRPAGKDTVGRAVGTLAFGLVGSDAYAAAHTRALRAGRWNALDYVGFDDQHADFDAERWLRALADPVRPWLRCSYALGIYDGILTGAGLGVLARFATAADARFTPVIDDIPELRQKCWMAWHASLRDSARVRAVAEFIVQVFEDL